MQIVNSGSDMQMTLAHPVAIRGHNNDGRMTSSHLSLLGSKIRMDDFCPSLLYYHRSDVVVAIDKIPVTTVAYGPFLQ
jgi:hypothetical protein